MWCCVGPVRLPLFRYAIKAGNIRSVIIRWMLALLLAGALPLAAQAASQKPGKSEPVTQVYLIRGFMGIFSTGLDRMAKDLAKIRIKAEVHGHLNGSGIRAKILRQRAQSTRKRPKLVLVGHSFGGNAALAIAKQLRAEDIKVDLVVTVDPTRSGPVSDNVRRYVNYYFPGNGLGAKLNVNGALNKRIKNIDMRKHVDVANAGDDHWTVTHNAAVQREILSAVKTALR